MVLTYNILCTLQMFNYEDCGNDSHSENILHLYFISDILFKWLNGIILEEFNPEEYGWVFRFI